MKKIAVLISMMLICTLTACGGSKTLAPEEIKEGTPEATVLKMFELMEETDLNQIAALLGADQANRFEKGGFIEFIEASNETLTYEISEAKIDGEKATVDVTCTYKDLQPLFAEAFRNYVADVLAYSISGKEPTDEEMIDMIAYELGESVEASDTETAGTATTTVTVDCIQMDGTWLIDTSEVNNTLGDVMTGNLISAYASASEAMNKGK